MLSDQNCGMMFPFVMSENQFNFDPNISTQLHLVENLTNSCPVELVSCIHNEPNNFVKPCKRSKDADEVGAQQMLQMSLGNFVQDELGNFADPHMNIVSTGLRLSYEDDEHNSSVTSASGSISALPIFSHGESLQTEIGCQQEELDRYIRIQEQQLVKGVKELRRRHLTTLLRAIDRNIGSRLRKKEAEIEAVNRKNRELIDRINHVAAEAQAWHYRVQHSESIVNMLKANLSHALAQRADQNVEGCGDNEMDVATSFVNQHGASCRENSVLLPQLICRACGTREISFLILPCRHLCLCNICDGYIEACPMCKSLKAASLQVFFS